MLRIVGFHVPLVDIEGDGPLGDIEGEVAAGAVVVLPAAMGLAKDVIDEYFDSLLQRPGLAVDRGNSPASGGDLDLDLWQRDDIVSSFGLDHLDLAAVAAAVEIYEDGRDPRRGESVEEGGLVGNKQFARDALILALLLLPGVGGRDGNVGWFGIAHEGLLKMKKPGARPGFGWKRWERVQTGRA